MVVVDVNVLVNLVNEAAPNHRGTFEWWTRTLKAGPTIGLPWISLVGFLRIATHLRILPQPLSPKRAVAKVDGWLRHPNTRLVGETAEHFRILGDLLLESGKAGEILPDAHLAAIAIGNGAQLASCDTDFARFRKLRWLNPLDAV
ncbi:MAG: TA system VapC family ribonuclease toxin [Lacipirellulaceae bacterium]